MLEADTADPDASRSGRADIILIDDFQHVGARLPRDGGERSVDHDQDRHGRVFDELPKILGGADIAHDRKKLQPQAEDPYAQNAQPEQRDAVHRRDDDGQHLIDDASAEDRADHADQDAEDRTDHQRRNRQ